MFGERVLLEAKAPRRSVEEKERFDLMMELTLMNESGVPNAPALVEPTDRLEELSASASGRNTIKQLLPQLKNALKDTIVELCAAGKFPAIRHVSLNGEQLLRVEVRGQAGAVGGRQTGGFRFGAGQFPAGSHGVVGIEPANFAAGSTFSTIAAEVRRWLEGENEGRLYAPLAGALIIGSVLLEEMTYRWVEVVMKHDSRVRFEPEMLERLFGGLNATTIRLAQWWAEHRSPQVRDQRKG